MTSSTHLFLVAFLPIVQLLPELFLQLVPRLLALFQVGLHLLELCSHVGVDFLLGVVDLIISNTFLSTEALRRPRTALLVQKQHETSGTGEEARFRRGPAAKRYQEKDSTHQYLHRDVTIRLKILR